MSRENHINRREFLAKSAIAATVTAGLAVNPVFSLGKTVSGNGKRVIVIGIDGMDPLLSQRMMDAGKLPNFDKLRKAGGYKPLITSIPPQSPVAWANFINGAGPGSHGIFDFIHRYPEKQCVPFFAMADTIPSEGGWTIGEHKVQLDFWPFNHKPSKTVLNRQGTPFWDYLDEAKVESTFYDLPSNYPPSESKHGHHRCLAGMGTPDLLGTYGTYQHYSELGPYEPLDEGGGIRYMLFFENERATGKIRGPVNTMLVKPQDTEIDFVVHRDTDANAALIEIQDKRILLRAGQWSDWTKLTFRMSVPGPDKKVSGICRFYLQQVRDDLKLYVTPINCDPSKPAMKITEPDDYIQNISKRLGLFYTTGFQEDHKALSNGVFSDDEYKSQASMVLDERLRLLDYALENYDDGLLFFYFSSTDLQSHMFWWDSDKPHPVRSDAEAKKYFGHIHDLYAKMDEVLGMLLSRYGDKATLFVMSDHGFANFKRQFNLNTWLKAEGYLGPEDATGILSDVDWGRSKAYGLGINGLYINLRGREAYGTVEPGAEYELYLQELKEKLESVTDEDGRRVVAQAHRADKSYKGDAMAFAPDLVVGYSRDYRASWDTCLGNMGGRILYDNDSAWSADHCADVSEVPGVLFCNRPIAKADPALVDIAPTILAEFGLETPESMQGRSVF